MGYTTTFSGEFNVTPALDDDTIKLLEGIRNTRRVKRDLTEIMPLAAAKLFGDEGEFYTGGGGFKGQDSDDSVLDSNNPPATQPGLWCQWQYIPETQTIEWDGGEKFYYYVEWIAYLIRKILAPRGYVVNGDIHWNGEESGDLGMIRIVDNTVQEMPAIISYTHVGGKTYESNNKI